MMILFHGSPSLFDRFDLSNVGEGSGDWTTCGFLTTLWRSGGVKFSRLTPERVASALSEGQRYASRNCSYFTTCCDELLDELGVRGIVEKTLG